MTFLDNIHLFCGRYEKKELAVHLALLVVFLDDPEPPLAHGPPGPLGAPVAPGNKALPSFLLAPRVPVTLCAPAPLGDSVPRNV